MDFDNTVQTGIMPPSTGADLIDLDIAITNDAINEPEEGFILMLAVSTTDSADSANLQVNMSVLLGIIDDNDSKYSITVIFYIYF